MKKEIVSRFPLIVALALALRPPLSLSAGAASPEAPAVGLTDFLRQRLVGEPALIVDVRPARADYEKSHIPGAVHIGMADLENDLRVIPRDMPLLVVCGWSECSHARPAAQRLSQAGFANVRVLQWEGGLASWSGAGLPVETEPRTLVEMLPKVSRGGGVPASGLVTDAPVSLLVVLPDPAPPHKDPAAVWERLSRSFPHLEVKTLTLKDARAKTLVRQFDLKALPAGIVEGPLRPAEAASLALRRKIFLEEKDGRFLVSDQLITPWVRLDRKERRGLLDVFIMSQCPYGVEAGRRLLQEVKAGRTPKDLRITFHYIVAAHPAQVPAATGPALKESFTSMHGSGELEEDVRQLVIQKNFPDKFADYFLARAVDYRSSLWDDAARGAGLDPDVIRRLYAEEGRELLAREAFLTETLGVHGSPQFLWENRFLVNRSDELEKRLGLAAGALSWASESNAACQ